MGLARLFLKVGKIYAKLAKNRASFQNEDKIGLQFYWSKFGTGSGFGIRDSGFGIRAFINGKQVFYG